MMKKAAALALVLAPALAHAQAQTQTADTLVVVTPNAPTVVVTGGGAAPAAPVVAPSNAPGAEEAPPAAPPATPAPQNEAWSNVSHINGQLVPVGERNAYLYNFKRTNLATNPIAAMFGYYDITASYALSQNVTIRGDISAWSTDHSNQSGVELSASLPIYFKRAYSGPFFEPGLVYHGSNNNSYAYDCIDCSSSSSDVWFGPEMLIGWSWIFDSGLNMSAAFGAAKAVSNSTMDTYSSDEPKPVGYFRIGYAF